MGTLAEIYWIVLAVKMPPGPNRAFGLEAWGSIVIVAYVIVF